MRIIILTIFLFNYIFAITLTPLYNTVNDIRELKTIFTVENPSNHPVAVKVSVERVTDTDNNKEKTTKTANINYYPAQFVLDSKSSKNIRITYLNKNLPKIEEVYRVLATELDVNVRDREPTKVAKGEKRAEVIMRFSYGGFLFVKDKSAKPNIKIESFQNLSDGALEIVMTNSGTASFLFNQMQHNLKAIIDGKEYILSEDDLKDAEFRRVLANKSNRFILRNIKSVSPSAITYLTIEDK